MSLIDLFGRRINYLRLSVTDRCNLRCSYCMPSQGVIKKGHCEILRFEELYRIAATATKLGVDKIRITGGEPLVRKGILDFLHRLSALPQLKELVLTTNGILLPELAQDLADAGVQRLNISLDSLEADTFARITRRGALSSVLAGIDAAARAGLPLKINTVVMRGVNDHEILDFIRLTLKQKLSVRFIEYMPVIKEKGWQSLVMTGEEILKKIRRIHAFDPLDSGRGCGPAQMFRVRGSRGSFGLITPLSGHFCAHCNRIRVASDGHASSCLFGDNRIDLRPALSEPDDVTLRATFNALIKEKPERHHLSTLEAPHEPFVMANIGG
ncbi:MAG: GTP 3',8-cyclase MoaA [Desulfuromonas sp.]|nr:MAG: GTP 3',8-cyclase MoaA [Desulfuromonas sp.]